MQANYMIDKKTQEEEVAEHPSFSSRKEVVSLRCWLGPPAGEEDAHGAGITMVFLYTHTLCKSPEGWEAPFTHTPWS